jgi:hypothetical protein
VIYLADFPCLLGCARGARCKNSKYFLLCKQKNDLRFLAPVKIFGGYRASKMQVGLKNRPCFNAKILKWLCFVAADRRPHNLKVAGSNPAPATNIFNDLAALC